MTIVFLRFQKKIYGRMRVSGLFARYDEDFPTIFVKP